ncbi:tryptophan synthase subunit alpha [Paenibacillus sp. GCM10027626]|uniref:tryptophan synthase subunit alpha n=1 Tax=Paenibacillus sp. GCM10027626 TaxID=3273411 RepID=UPI00362FE74E
MKTQMLNGRNRETWLAAKKREESLLIGYLVAGDPTAGESLQMLKESVEAGIDVVEMGVPSPNPEMDGPIIQRAHQRALSGGMDAEEALLAYWRSIRQQLSAPIWAMGYKRDVLDSGFYRQLIRENMVDAFVLPDCSLEEQIALQEEIAPHGIDVVRFINSAMDDAAIQAACSGATVIYAQSYAGTTGDPLANMSDLSGLCTRIRKYLPDGLLVAGFGLRSPLLVSKAIEGGFDGAVVGSALVARCENRENDYLYRLIAEMKMETLRSSGEGMTE